MDKKQNKHSLLIHFSQLENKEIRLLSIYTIFADNKCTVLKIKANSPTSTLNLPLKWESCLFFVNGGKQDYPA